MIYLVLGNSKGVRRIGDPDEDWKNAKRQTVSEERKKIVTEELVLERTTAEGLKLSEKREQDCEHFKKEDDCAGKPEKGPKQILSYQSYQ